MRYVSAIVLIVLAGSLLPVGGQEPAGWGSIKGQIVWEGDIPKPATIKVDKDQEHCLSKGDIPSDQWVIGKDKGIRWVLVWLVPDPASGQKTLAIHPDLKAPKDKSVSIDQPCCMFIPHVLAMREGQDLVVKNSAPVAHNVNWTGHPLFNPGGNVLIPPGKEYTIAGLKAQKLPLPVACNIHGWMKSYIGVYNHPYFAVTDENGNFEIKDAPAGKHRLMIWHETGYLGGASGSTGKEVEVKAGGAADLGKITWKDK